MTAAKGKRSEPKNKGLADALVPRLKLLNAGRAKARLSELAAERHLPAEIVEPLHAHHRDRLKHLEHRSDGAHRQFIERYDEIEALLISAERSLINDLYRAGELKDEARRRIERELDLREAHLTNLRSDG